MTVNEIVEKYLKNNNFDGLYCDEGDPCWCGMDNLMPCQNPNDLCMPGKKIPCECGENCGFHIWSPETAKKYPYKEEESNLNKGEEL